MYPIYYRSSGRRYATMSQKVEIRSFPLLKMPSLTKIQLESGMVCGNQGGRGYTIFMVGC